MRNIEKICQWLGIVKPEQMRNGSRHEDLKGDTVALAKLVMKEGEKPGKFLLPHGMILLGWWLRMFMEDNPYGIQNQSSFRIMELSVNKGFLRRSMSVEVRPSSYFGVALCYQPGCCSLFVVLDDLSDAWKKRLHVFLRGAWKEVPLVLTDILSEKVKSVLKVRYAGLLFRKFQSSFLEKVRDEWCDCIFQHLFRDARDDEVIRITYQVYLLILALKCAPAGVWVLLSEYPFQAIQRHIGALW